MTLIIYITVEMFLSIRYGFGSNLMQVSPPSVNTRGCIVVITKEQCNGGFLGCRLPKSNFTCKIRW